jgi:hypothetical protein
MPWIMSYDLFPTETLEYKRQILPKAALENWWCLFYHDIDVPLSKISQDGSKLVTI